MLRKAPIRTRKAVKLSTESVSHTGTELEIQLHGVESYLAGVLATRCRSENHTLPDSDRTLAGLRTALYDYSHTEFILTPPIK